MLKPTPQNPNPRPLTDEESRKFLDEEADQYVRAEGGKAAPSRFVGIGGVAVSTGRRKNRAKQELSEVDRQVC